MLQKYELISCIFSTKRKHWGLNQFAKNFSHLLPSEKWFLLFSFLRFHMSVLATPPDLNPPMPWTSSHFLPQMYPPLLVFKGVADGEKWRERAHGGIQSERINGGRRINQRGRVRNWTKRQREIGKNGALKAKGRSGRTTDGELWWVRGPFAAGEEVFGFYWFHMTRQNLFKML